MSVFIRTKHGTSHLAEQFDRDGIRSAAIHGNKSQGVRTCVLADFKSGNIHALVAADAAAHGLGVKELSYVANYELSNIPEGYVHRIGRTGRAAATGETLSLVCIDEHELLRDIEKLLRKEIPRIAIPGYEPGLLIKTKPIQNGRQQRGGNSCGQDGGRGQQQLRHGEGGAESASAESTGRPSRRLGDARPAGERQRRRRLRKSIAVQ